MRSKVEKFFRYLKERTIVFHNKLSARNYMQEITNLNLFTLYYESIRSRSAEVAYLDAILIFLFLHKNISKVAITLYHILTV